MNPTYDYAFIGSGISSTFTLIHFLEKLKSQDHPGFQSIAVIDKYPEFHNGIPYGKRSGHTTLLITSLRNFLPKPELSKFVPWLNKNKRWLLSEFKEKGGPLSKEWLDKNENELRLNDWEELFIPRSFFGYYIDEKIKILVNHLQSRNIIKVHYVHGKVENLSHLGQDWSICMENRDSMVAKKAILCIGSLPTNYLFRNKKIVEKDKFLLLNNLYIPELGKNIDKIRSFVKSFKDDEVVVSIIGANASGLEILYQLNDHPEIKEKIGNYYMVSSQGLLPDSTIDLEKLNSYRTKNLDALNDEESVKASDIAQAVYQDLDLAEKIGLGAASTVKIISQKFGSLLCKLNQEELENFACFYGNQIGRRQRCAGEHYASTAAFLKKKGIFSHIAGRFSTIKKETTGYFLEYTNSKGQSNRVPQPINLIINCIGSMDLNHKKIPKPLKNLISSGIVTANKSQIGIKVNEKLEAADNLHVIGPLLAGNVIEGKAVWHVEHCGRIIWLSQSLSDILFKTKLSNTNELRLRNFKS